MAPGASSSSLNDSPLRSGTSSPAVFLSLTYALGVLADHLFSWSASIWAILAGAALLMLILLMWKQLHRCSLCVLLVGLFAMGGYAHHDWWQATIQHPFISQLKEEPLPVRLRVRLLETPSYRQPPLREFTPLWRASGRSTFPAECLSWNREQPISGQVLVNVSGQLVGPQAGDIVEVLGTIRKPERPRNPGEFDYRTWSLRHGLLAYVNAEHPRQILLLEHKPLSLVNFLPRLRARLSETFLRNLKSGPEAGIAGTLILGDRSNLPYDVKRSFLRSGAFHLLAISGLHIGLIAFLMLRLFGLLNFSVRQSALLTIVVLTLYACLTGLRPSVLRATIFLVIYLGSQLFGRAPHRANTLGLTVFILLLLDPATLFDSGAQLSCLAVIAIFTVSPFLSHNRSNRQLLDRAARGLQRPLVNRMYVKLRELLSDGFLIGVAVWIFTFPIAAGSFHLFPMWAIPLTILLIPFITAALIAGWLYLICAYFVPVLIPLLEPVLNAVLSVVCWIVTLAAELPGSGQTLATTPVWWNLGYLAGVVCLLVPQLRMPHLWKAMFAWVCLHLLLGHIGHPRDQTEITVYSVGHGLAVLLEFPDESRMLYDCGSHDGGLIAANVILADFRERGITHLDRVYLSHADLDHYSALPDLLEEIEISEIVTTEALMQSSETNLVQLRRLLQTAGCELDPAVRGMHESISQEVSLEVLHPPTAAEFSSDNAASLVLYLRTGEVGVLLTGDLEAEGLSTLLAREAPRIDILLSPHHGSLAANPVQLSDWCRPRYVIVSSGHRVQWQRLNEIYSECDRVYCTEYDGAVRFSISPEGRVSVTTFRDSNALSL